MVWFDGFLNGTTKYGEFVNWIEINRF